MKISPGLLLKLSGIIFAAGMLYSSVKASGEQTRRDIVNLEHRLDRIEEYLDAKARNGL